MPRSHFRLCSTRVPSPEANISLIFFFIFASTRCVVWMCFVRFLQGSRVETSAIGVVFVRHLVSAVCHSNALRIYDAYRGARPAMSIDRKLSANTAPHSLSQAFEGGEAKLVGDKRRSS